MKVVWYIPDTRLASHPSLGVPDRDTGTVAEMTAFKYQQVHQVVDMVEPLAADSAPPPIVVRRARGCVSPVIGLNIDPGCNHYFPRRIHCNRDLLIASPDNPARLTSEVATYH
jgi:hypothetical protein